VGDCRLDSTSALPYALFTQVSGETVWKLSNYPTDGHKNCRNGSQKACSCTVVVPKPALQRPLSDFPDNLWRNCLENR
jgi:hypothetical protein